MIFSVVIPLYNKRRFIEQTLRSVREQTVQDFEVIVVDDGSTDDGALLAQQYAGHWPHFRCIHQTNAGVSAARNTGIALAVGQWVAFLDADDYWHPEYLQTLCRLIQTYPVADMVATNLHTRPDEVHWSPEPWPTSFMAHEDELIQDLHRRWFQGLPFITSSVAVRTLTLQNMQPCFALGESNGEDLDLWFRLSETTPIARSKRALIAYRDAPTGGLTSQISKLSEPPYLQRMLSRAQGAHLPGKTRSAMVYFVAQQRVSIARRLLECGQRRKAGQMLLKAWPVLFSPRWLSTALMAIAFPCSLVQRWDAWRYHRRAVHG